MQPDERDGNDNLTQQVPKWRSILSHIKNGHSDADWGVFAGDLVDRGVPVTSPPEQSSHYSFADFEADITSYLPKEKLFVTSGNHDFGYPAGQQNLDEFLSWWPDSRTYYIRRGNFIWIFMGDEEYGQSGNLDTATFNWWNSLVQTHTDKNIITVTHQPLHDTLAGSAIGNNWRIVDSSRFTDVLDTVDHHALWIAGHNGGVSSAPYRGYTHPATVSHVQKHGTWHVQVGLHIPSFMESGNIFGDPMSYCTWHVEDGASFATIRRWNADTALEVPEKRFTVALKYPAQINPGTPDFDSRD